MELYKIFESRVLVTFAFGPFPYETNDEIIFLPFKRIQHPQEQYFRH